VRPIAVEDVCRLTRRWACGMVLASFGQPCFQCSLALERVVAWSRCASQHSSAFGLHPDWAVLMVQILCNPFAGKKGAVFEAG